MNLIILNHSEFYYWEFICCSMKAGISEVLHASQAALPAMAELHNRAQIIPVLKKTHHSSQVPAWEPSKDNGTIVHLKIGLENRHSGIKYSWVRNNSVVLRPLGWIYRSSFKFQLLHMTFTHRKYILGGTGYLSPNEWTIKPVTYQPEHERLP